MFAHLPKTSRSTAMPARVGLACYERLSNTEAAKRLGGTAATVCKWRKRFPVNRLGERRATARRPAIHTGPPNRRSARQDFGIDNDHRKFPFLNNVDRDLPAYLDVDSVVGSHGARQGRSRYGRVSGPLPLSHPGHWRQWQLAESLGTIACRVDRTNAFEPGSDRRGSWSRTMLDYLDGRSDMPSQSHELRIGQVARFSRRTPAHGARLK
jgi:hypothetical protein